MSLRETREKNKDLCDDIAGLYHSLVLRTIRGSTDNLLNVDRGGAFRGSGLIARGYNDAGERYDRLGSSCLLGFISTAYLTRAQDHVKKLLSGPPAKRL